MSERHYLYLSQSLNDLQLQIDRHHAERNFIYDRLLEAGLVEPQVEPRIRSPMTDSTATNGQGHLIVTNGQAASMDTNGQAESMITNGDRSGYCVGTDAAILAYYLHILNTKCTLLIKLQLMFDISLES